MCRYLVWLWLLPMFAQATVAGNVLLVTDLSDQQLSHRNELRVVAGEAVNQLNDFQVTTGRTRVRPDTEENIQAMLTAAQQHDMDYLAIATLYDQGGRKRMFALTLYQTENGEVIYQYSKLYKIRNMKALLAQIEYELPLVVKRDFNELGRIINIKGQRIYFDIGTASGIQLGDVVRIFRPGQAINSMDGKHYGYELAATGMARVIAVNSSYAIADISVGRSSVKNKDWVELADDSTAAEGHIIAMYDDDIAIDLGRRSGVSPGSYFAVYQQAKAIDDEHAFRSMIGRIKITDVEDQMAHGRMMRSDQYDLARALIKEGDNIEEVPYRHQNQMLFGVNSFDVTQKTEQAWTIGLQMESAGDSTLSYRIRGGQGENLWFAGLGFAKAVHHSESFRYGLDLMVSDDGLGSYAYVDADIPNPLSDYVRFGVETGYLIGAIDEVQGISVGLTARLGLGNMY